MGTVACGKLDLRDVAETDKIIYGNRAYLRADVDERIYIWYGLPYCVLKIGSPVYAIACLEQASIGANMLMANTALNNKGEEESLPPEDQGDTDLGGNNARTAPANTDVNTLNTAQQSVGITDINRFKYMPACVMPAVAAIPMRSNIRTYGPYASSNFGLSTGGINVENNTDICPWVYGSIASMHAAGLSIVENASFGLNRAETGSVTIPGYPDRIGTLGGALIKDGPTLTDLNFSYGSNGVTTTYKFQTFTPKRGTINNQTQEKLKLIAKNRTEQLRFLRNQAINNNKIGRKVIMTTNRPGPAIQNSQGGVRSGNTLGRVLVGEMYDWNKLNDGSNLNRTIVGVADLPKSTAEMVHSYNTKAYTSFDFFFGPVSKSGDGGLPQFGQYSMLPGASSNGVGTSGTSIGAHPPVSDWYDPENVSLNELVMDQYNLSINRQYLDPLITPDTNHHHGSENKTTTGFPYDIIGRGSGLPPSGLLNSRYKMNAEQKYISNSGDFRFHAIRGPLVLQAWGYDTDGKPIPNESDTDTEAGKGNFTRESLKDKFLSNWISKPKTWPVAPVDLRYDRNRGVWTAPPPYRIIAAELLEDLDAGQSAAAKILKDFDQTLYDNEGQPIQNPTIRIKDRIDSALSKGTKVYCYFDTYLAEYIAFSSTDAWPVIITGVARATFRPSDKIAPVLLIQNATLDGNNINPGFRGYSSSKPDILYNSSFFAVQINAYNVKRCGAMSGDLVTIHRVSMQGYSVSEQNDSPYAYTVIHTGESNEAVPFGRVY
jgi:hypothetical protein